MRPINILTIAGFLTTGFGLWAADAPWPKTRPADAKYTCAMEEHPDEADPARRGPYWSTEPGPCPRCGMKMKDLSAYAWTAKYPPVEGTTARAQAAESAEKNVTTRPAGERTVPEVSGLPPDMRYACPMERHPDEKKLTDRGPYFADSPGDCPKCGMKLKPASDLGWTAAWRAAEGSEVAYTCPDHPHVLAHEDGTCPRCGRDLEPFKVMYTCPNPRHAGTISRELGRCPHDGQALAPFRGIWLAEAMSVRNVPATTQPAADAAYRCPRHPLVHSDSPAACTICATPLEPAGVSAAPRTMPADDRPAGRFVCPMHPQEVKADAPGTCSICAMQLVPAARLLPEPSAPQRVQREMDHLMEHYLAVQKLLASDSTTDLARHALGLTAASEEMLKHVDGLDAQRKASIKAAAQKVHDAALKFKGERIADDRVHLADLSTGMVALLDHLRPDRQRWPELYVFHCPMSKGDWIQTSKDKANPYYGFAMLKCGELTATK
jgi:hypothetical protein